MRSLAILFLFLGVVFSSCEGNKNGIKRKKLIRAWHSVRLENKDIDVFFTKTQMYIDTFGRNNDNATNMELYGTTNIDSLRKLIQERFDSTKSIQLRSVTNTIIEFRPDSQVYLSFNGALDTSKWILGPDNMLTLEDRNIGMNNEKVVWEVLELTDTSLVVKMKQDTTYSRVTFHPEGKY